MNIMYILLTMIQLTYREKLTEHKYSNSSNLITDLIAELDTSKKFKTRTNTNEAIQELVSILDYIILSDNIEVSALRQKLTTALMDSGNMETVITELLDDGVNNEYKIKQLRNELFDSTKIVRVQNILSDSSYRVNIETSSIGNITNFVRSLTDKLSVFYNEDGNDPLLIDDIGLDDEDKATEILELHNSSKDSILNLTTGWQDINIMFQHCLARGNFMNINALQSRYKTIFTASLFISFAMFNKPKLLDKTKLPYLVWFSLEDSTAQVLTYWFEIIMANKDLYPELDIKEGLSKREEIQIIYAVFKKNGWNLRLQRIETGETFNGMASRMQQVERKFNAEIFVSVWDYMLQLATDGMSKTEMGSEWVDMVARAATLAGKHKCLLISPWHLNAGANNLLKNGWPEEEFALEMAKNGYTERATKIIYKTHMELNLHIVEKKVGEEVEAFLFIALGKHKGPNEIDNKLKQVIYRFPKVGRIPFDLNKKKMGMRKIYMENHSEESSFDF